MQKNKRKHENQKKKKNKNISVCIFGNFKRKPYTIDQLHGQKREFSYPRGFTTMGIFCRMLCISIEFSKIKER